MVIRDYESGRTLNDIDIVLDREEVEELAIYLRRLLSDPGLNSVQMSQVEGLHLCAEVSVTLSHSLRRNSGARRQSPIQ